MPISLSSPEDAGPTTMEAGRREVTIKFSDTSLREHLTGISK